MFGQFKLYIYAGIILAVVSSITGLYVSNCYLPKKHMKTKITDMEQTLKDTKLELNNVIEEKKECVSLQKMKNFEIKYKTAAEYYNERLNKYYPYLNQKGENNETENTKNVFNTRPFTF